MQQARTGFAMACASAQELAKGWRAYWQIVTPWGYVYFILSTVYYLRYPQGAGSYVISLLWQLLFYGLILLMAWNWANALGGRSERLDFSRGWHDRSWLDYVSGLTVGHIVVPFLLVLAVTIPVGMVDAVLQLNGQKSAFAIYFLIVMSWLIYYHARMLLLSPLLIEQRPMPIPTAWKASARHLPVFLPALLTLVLGLSAAQLLVAAAGSLLAMMGLSFASLLLWPLSWAAGVFFYGSYFLLARKAYDLVQKG